jgi:hypothetical protein
MSILPAGVFLPTGFFALIVSRGLWLRKKAFKKTYTQWVWGIYTQHELGKISVFS